MDTQIKNHVGRSFPTKGLDEMQELFAAGERVAELVASPAWADVRRVLDGEIENIDALLEMTSSEPLSQAKYAQLLGRRGGLKAGIEVADAIVAHASKTFADQQRKADGESSGN